MKQLIPYLLVIILTLLWVRECNRKPETKTITRTVTITVPEIIKQLDTIYKPIPTVIRETDTIILKEFLSASDSLKIAMYVNATLEREYTQTFKDSNQSIDVWSKTRGELLEQSVSYHIFERTISQTDTITIPQSRSLYLLPTISSDLSGFRAGVGILYQDRAKRLFYAGYDTEQYWTIGMGVKF